MAAASKFSANERLVRKRLAARLRQRRCRERKREAAALSVKQVDVQVGTAPTSSAGESPRIEIQQPVLHQEHVVVRDAAQHPLAYPRPSGTWNQPMPEAATPEKVNKHPSTLLESAMASPRSDYGPVPVSPGNSTAEAEVVVTTAPPTNKPLASQEMAAIDAMLALRSNDASSTDEAEEETGSTSSLSSKGGHSSQMAVSNGRMKVPETVYHHHYCPAPPPPTLGYYHYHNHHLAPPQTWGPHYLPHHPHHHPYHPLPPPQPSYYWTGPSHGKPPHVQPSSSSVATTVASRVRA